MNSVLTREPSPIPLNDTTASLLREAEAARKALDAMQLEAIEEVQIGKDKVGRGHPCYIAAEIGINHNGDVELAKKLINVAAASGCNAVKFQKRTIDVVYTAEELARPRESPFGNTNGDLKRALEFGQKHYEEIDRY